jgi:type VI secretion system secreted protein VgrG
MGHDVFTLKCAKLDGASFVGFRGVERISRPYEYELFFTVPTGTSVRKAVGERATLKGDRTDTHEPFVVHGVLASVKLLHQTSERALYQALLVPRLWLLRQFWRSYVFTKENVKTFLTDTLTAGGLATSEFRFEIEESLYDTEEFVAQYRESHLDFFHRWLEREGLYYYFEHKEDASNEVIVVVDSLGRHANFSSNGRVSYIPLFGDDATAPEGLHQLEAETRWLPKTVTIADFNYANPSASLKSKSAIAKGGAGAISEYGYRAFDGKNLERLANVRAQAIGCRETVLRAGGDVLGPRAGYRFAIDDKPDDVEEKWLALEVEHIGAVSGMTPEVARLTKLSTTHTYAMSLVAIPIEVQYRAPQDTAWPRIYGFENGVVCGDATSQYAQLDKDGRYLVRFEFDTSDLPDGKASTRVRMLQPHGGDKEGFHFPLRKGTEVMIGFLGGDPDRPFIAGVVPNAHKPSVVGERNHTQNVIRSGSGNQVVLEDEQGKEFVFISTPNNSTGFYMGHPAGRHESVYTGEGATIYMFIGPEQANPAVGPVLVGSTGGQLAVSLRTDGNAGFEIGGSFWTNVDKDLETFVGGDVGLGYRGTHTLHIGKDSTENYYANRTTTVTSGQEDTIKGTGLKQTITGGLTQTVTWGGGTLDVTGGWTHKVSAENHDDYGSWHAEAKSSINIHCTAGVVTIKSPTKIILDAPEVKSMAHYQWFKKAAFTIDLYGSKNSFGIQKADACGLSISATGQKLDATGSSLAATGSKTETVGNAMSITTMKVDLASCKFANKPLELEIGEIGIFSGAMEARAKAFMKL